VTLELLIVRNPDTASSLPFLMRIPLGATDVILKVRDTWPRTSKVYCHRTDEWPDEPEVVERVALRSCVRRGASIDMHLDRARENRSQIVFANARGRDVIFWQTARTAKQARPAVDVPTARAAGIDSIEILVDSHERYAWNFAKQRATTRKRPLVAGDYAVELDGAVIAAVERKSLDDLATTITTGRLRSMLTALADTPHAAVVVENRWSNVFQLTFVRPSAIAEAVAEALIRFPQIPIMFCETRQLAMEWSYRFFGAALWHAAEDVAASHRLR
jgi:hypothetical protein